MLSGLENVKPVDYLLLKIVSVKQVTITAK